MTSPARRRRAPRWLLRDPSPDSAARLFCLPYSGCGASMFHRWPRFIGDLEICPVQPPGRENRIREPAPATYQDLAGALIPTLRPHLDRPFGFFGHCGSALAAYEVAAQLVAACGPIPRCVVVSSEVAPQDGPYGRFLSMNRAELTVEMAAIVRHLGGTPVPDLLDLAVTTLATDVAANAAYVVPDPTRLPGRVLALSWTDDADVRPEQMKGWDRCGDTRFVTLPGGHFTFLDPPDVLRDVLLTELLAPS
ncbi:thioesterase II family protein [Micromonospora sp. CNB394]|uniref:thioesterase II family protein n=1 Tax=Micromonospora sp. CNB394 TaxID=1169151 RepID=UPI0003A9423E|nr:thioesterase domain-containing protein [Micromonospora sp. CNB394]